MSGFIEAAEHRAALDEEVRGRHLADEAADQYDRTVAAMSQTKGISGDLGDVMLGLGDVLAPLVAGGEHEAIGIAVCAAWRAYVVQVATKNAYGEREADMEPTPEDAAAKALLAPSSELFAGTRAALSHLTVRGV